MNEKLIAELIFADLSDATAAKIALGEAGYAVEERPDWDDVAPESGCVWLTAAMRADDVYAFALRIEELIEPYDGTIWVCGTPEVNAAYNETGEFPEELQ